MNRLLIALLILLFASPSVQANQWTSYMSYHNATKSFVVGERIYTLANGDLFYYIPSNQQTHLFSKTNGLNGGHIQWIEYCEEAEVFLLIYEDYNMDILTLDDKLINIPQYKNSNLKDKTINQVSIADSRAYLSTNFGLVEVDLLKAEFKNTYNYDIPTQNSVVTPTAIYIETSKGIFSGDRKKNLLDKNNWHKMSGYIGATLFLWNEDIYGLIGGDFCEFDESYGDLRPLNKDGYKYYSNSSSNLILWNNSQMAIVKGKQISAYALPQTCQYLSMQGDSIIWACCDYAGLQKWIIKGKKIEVAEDSIIPNSPLRNLSYSLRLTPQNRLLVAGGSLNYSANFYPGTIMALENNGQWTNFEDQNIPQLTGLDFHNVTEVAEDPNDSRHHYVSAACGGLYEFKDFKFVHLYDHKNSPISSILPTDASSRYYTRTGGVCFDNDHNLWFFNNQVDTILRVLRNDGSWHSFYFKELEGYPTFDHMVFDKKGRLWITHRRLTAVHFAGIGCLDYNKTLTNKADDVFRFQYNLTNQDNVTTTPNQVYDIKFDHNGALWIATDRGPFVLRNPDTFFESQTTFEQVKVPRNDGTNYADYLLDQVPVTCIAIDGGNRKWFGTSGSGVYLIADDDITTVQHFTSANSPLLSDVVYSIEINGENGEVFFGTDAGIISYRSDATDPAPSLNESNLKAYPNPVRPGFTGNVKVEGFSTNADVKVTTVGGQVIYRGTSVGGTFSWNLRNFAGKSVSSGVYYIIGSDAMGNKGATTKVLVIRE